MAICNKCGGDAGYLFSICRRCKEAGDASLDEIRSSSRRRLTTHYDTLNVAWFAPEQVVRAAYKALCQMHHPDKNGNNQESVRLMQRINSSYDVLSDPTKRAEHDHWIRSNQ
ncbi:MAG: J domain-containing protein [Xanthomonadaceae bacterium]|nr:J domain-containing protein [Xanthomonadaceae bacterium]